MKKLLLIVLAAIAVIVLLSSIGPMIGLVICLGIAYFSLKQYMKSNETASKILWAVIGIIMLLGAISNAPAVIGLVAAYVLYQIYKNWDKKPEKPSSNDPFTNFEREWEELNKTYK